MFLFSGHDMQHKASLTVIVQPISVLTKRMLNSFQFKSTEPPLKQNLYAFIFLLWHTLICLTTTYVS